MFAAVISILSDATNQRILTKDSKEQTFIGDATKKGDDGGDVAIFISFRCSDNSDSLEVQKKIKI